MTETFDEWWIRYQDARKRYAAILRANDHNVMGTAKILRVSTGSIRKWEREDRMRGCKGIAGKRHRWPERTREWRQIHCLDCGTASHKPTHSPDTPWHTKPIPPKTLERIERKILSGEELQARRIVERMTRVVDGEKVQADAAERVHSKGIR